jgi:hypothetical protein
MVREFIINVIIIRGCIQKFPDWVDNEIIINNNNNNNNNTAAPSGWQLYNLQFSLQEASPETSGYTLISFFEKKTI